jgi:NTE family protein
MGNRGTAWHSWQMNAAPSAVNTVLVLGGGGGRGAAQLGILRALAERGVQPDACVGTSVGALNAMAVAARPLPEAVALLEEIWATPQTRAVFRGDLARIALNRLRRRPYLRSDECIRELVDYALGLMGAHTFEELPRPLSMIVTDLGSGEPVVVSRGRLRDVMRASCAIPGVFPPVTLGERQYVDGGVTENCGISVAARLKPGHIIAVDLSADEAGPAMRRFSEVLDRVMSAALHARVVADFDRFSARLPITLICPRLPRRRPVFADFATMREAARQAMDTLLQTIAGDGGLAPGVFYLPIPVEDGRRS